MNKVVAFLESYVEWVAVGIGALLLVWVVYAQVVTPQATAILGGTEYGPGEVDKHIKEKADQLDVLTTGTGGNGQTLEIPSAIGLFNDRLAGGAFPPLQPWIRTFDNLAPSPAPVPNGSDPLPNAGNALASLVEAPPVVIENVVAGRAYVNKQAAIAANQQPGAAPIAPAVMPVNGVDVNWVKVEYRFPVTQIQDAFIRARVPKQLNLLILQVDLIRETQMADGTFAEMVTVAPISTVTYQKLPDPGDKIGAAAFVPYAAQAFSQIVRPPFYQVILGEDPSGLTPMAVNNGNPNQPNQPAVFDPAVWLDTPSEQRVPKTLDELTPEQRRAVQLERKRRVDEAKAKKGGNRPPGGDGGGRGGRGGGAMGGGVVDDPERPAYLQPEFPEGPGGNFNPMPGSGNLQFPALPTLPNPPAAAQDFTGWAYDETAAPGVTYRYAVKYTIQNPVWNTQNMAQNAQIENQFAIESQQSDWSKPVTTAPLVNLFIAQKFAPAAGNIKVRVFKWYQGQPRPATFTIAPGDPVGGSDGGVEYRSGWTLVDIRGDASDGNKSYAIFLDDKGHLVRRDADADAADPERRKLEAIVNPPVAPGPPGMPPGMGPPGSGGEFSP